MTSQIVFMEHSPLTMLKRASSPNTLSNFLYSICSYPHHVRARAEMEYTPEFSGDDSQGSFHIKILRGQVEFRGKFFRNQTRIDNYLVSRGIALKLGLVNLHAIRSQVGGSCVLFLEEIKYSSITISRMAIDRAKSLLKVPTSTTGHYDRDLQFLTVKAGKLAHSRSGDLIPPDQWVPLYRQGSIFGTVAEDELINLEEVEHVIF